jgi:hypothetical protein
MKMINQLLHDIADGDITVTDVDVSMDSEQPGIGTIQVSCWSMQVAHVISFHIVMPYVPEVVEGYNFGDMGAKVQKGFRNLIDKLNKGDTTT